MTLLHKAQNGRRANGSTPLSRTPVHKFESSYFATKQSCSVVGLPVVPYMPHSYRYHYWVLPVLLTSKTISPQRWKLRYCFWLLYAWLFGYIHHVKARLLSCRSCWKMKSKSWRKKLKREVARHANPVASHGGAEEGVAEENFGAKGWECILYMLLTGSLSSWKLNHSLKLVLISHSVRTLTNLSLWLHKLSF